MAEATREHAETASFDQGIRKLRDLIQAMFSDEPVDAHTSANDCERATTKQGRAFPECSKPR